MGIRLVVLGTILVGAGAFGLYSDTRHQINGRPATATLLEHLTECTVEYQRIGEQRRKEKWPCAEAEEFQQRVGSNKAKITHAYLARVRFPLADGRMHEATVDDFKLGSSKLAIGATLPVVYAPSNPADVRAVFAWEQLKILLIMMAAGIACLAISAGRPLAALSGWAFRDRGKETGWASRDRGEETVSAPPEYRAPAPAPVNTYTRPTGSAPRASFGTRKG